MLHRAIATLESRLRSHVALSKDRRETLALLVVAMLSGRTVNLSHLAAERPGGALIASTYRRLQRFFQHVRLGQDWVAPIIAEFVGLAGSWDLVLDRTQWRVGARDVNFLVLAAVTRRVRVPLIWSVIEGPGCSDTEQRIALMRRYLGIFGQASIRILLADREFVGRAWIDFLCENNIPFAIRMKDELRVTSADGCELTLLARLRWRNRTKVFEGWLGTGEARGRHLLRFAGKRLASGEMLVVATNAELPHRALAAYRRRWAIECLFGDAKTRGLNLEDTRLTDPRKLDLLLALVALALAWSAAAAALLPGSRAPKRKAHGHLAKSWFRIGFDHTRNLLRTNPLAAIQPWLKLAPNPPPKARVV